MAAPDYLHICKDDTAFLLLQSPEYFHCVTVDASMTEQQFEKLLRIYPCTTQKLQDMGLKVTAFRKETLRGAVLMGYQTGAALELWVGSSTQLYQLGSDYTDEMLSVFFAGSTILRRLPPKWNGLPPGKIRGITWAVNGAAIAASLLFEILRFPYGFWSMLCIFCQLISLVLPVLFPASFTLMDIYPQRRNNFAHRKGNLIFSLIVPGFVLCQRTITDLTFQENGFLWLLGLSCGIFLLVFAGMFLFFKCTGHRRMLSLSVVLLMLFLGAGTVGQLNHILDTSQPRQIIAQVESTEVRRGIRATSYDCVVCFPDGTLKALSLSKSTYQEIVAGGDVCVEYHEGIFSVPYYTVRPIS